MVSQKPAMFDTEEFIAELHAQGGPALVAAVEKEFRTGWEMQKQRAEKKANAKSHVPHARSGGVDGAGYISSSIDPDSYFYWINKGRELFNVDNIWTEPEFRQDYLRDNPQDRVKYQSLNPRVGYTGAVEGAPIVLANKYTDVRRCAA